MEIGEIEKISKRNFRRGQLEYVIDPEYMELRKLEKVSKRNFIVYSDKLGDSQQFGPGI